VSALARSRALPFLPGFVRLAVRMNQPNITCPKCQHAFRLDESLAAPIVESTRRQFEEKLARQTVEMAQREAAIKQQQATLETAQRELEANVAAKVKSERERIAADELKKARASMADEFEAKARQLAELNEQFSQNKAKLAEAQKAQAAAIEKERALDDKLREADLMVQKRIDESLAAERAKAKKEAEDSLHLKVLEKEQTISSMAKQIEDLRRKAEQGSQQTQGEALELQLESLLKSRFPHDTIAPVPKGEFGGDVLQQVFSPLGQSAGTILWESKRTKAWSDGWLAKLRGDQRAAKAELCAIVSTVVPKGCDGFDFIDGVWVIEPRCAIPVAVALRQGMLDLAAARQAGEGQQTKMELVYHYLTGPRFRQRVNAIVEKFSEMRDDLDRERKFISKQWAKREAQLHAVIDSTAGMYGDLQGIAGKSLAEIEGLEPKLLDDQTENR